MDAYKVGYRLGQKVSWKVLLVIVGLIIFVSVLRSCKGAGGAVVAIFYAGLVLIAVVSVIHVVFFFIRLVKIGQSDLVGAIKTRRPQLVMTSGALSVIYLLLFIGRMASRRSGGLVYFAAFAACITIFLTKWGKLREFAATRFRGVVSRFRKWGREGTDEDAGEIFGDEEVIATDIGGGYRDEECVYEYARTGMFVRAANIFSYGYNPFDLDGYAGSGCLPPSNYFVDVLPYVIELDGYIDPAGRIRSHAGESKYHQRRGARASAKVDDFLYRQWKEKKFAGAVYQEDYCCFHIIPGPGEGITASQMEHFWSSLNAKDRVSFEIIADGASDSIVFQFVCHNDCKNQVAGLLSAMFGNAIPVEPEEDYLWAQFEDPRDFIHEYTSKFMAMGVNLGLWAHYGWPIRTFGSFDREGDPLTSLITALDSFLSSGKSGQTAVVQALVRPSGGRWEDHVNWLRDAEYYIYTTFDELPLSQKIRYPLFGVSLKLLIFGKREVVDEAEVKQCASEITDSFDVFASPDGNSIMMMPLEHRGAIPEIFWTTDALLSPDELTAVLSRNTFRHGFILNSQELSSLLHFPSASLQHSKLLRQETGIAKAPQALVVEEEVLEAEAEEESEEAVEEIEEMEEVEEVPQARPLIIGVNKVHGKEQKVHIPEDYRFRHVYIVGKTGTGKTTLLQNMVVQDIRAGRGVGVIDPHGDLVRDKILPYIPRKRVDDVVLFDPTDYGYPIGFNMFQVSMPRERQQMSNDILVAIRRLFGSSSWGENIDQLFGTAVDTLLADESRTYSLLDMRRLVSDEGFRLEVLERINDEYLTEYWTEDFPRMTASTISATKRRLSSILRRPEVRDILGQRDTTFALRDIMNRGKIFLANLSRGELGEDASDVFGGLLVSKIQLTAMSRATEPEAERVPFYLYVDEFQNFVSESFEVILSEARKYRLGLIIAHQFTGQLPKAVYDAVFGNVGTMVTFALGIDDAVALEKQMGKFTRDDIINLEDYHTFTRIGKARDTFSMITLPPPKITENLSDVIRQASREKYCREVTEEARKEEKEEEDGFIF